MSPTAPLTDHAIWPLVVYALIVVVLIAFLMWLSHVLGGRASGNAKNEPFESGVVPVGTAQLHFASHFYLIAMLFVIFDLETVFLFAWAVAFYESGWLGYIEAMVFIVVLIVALAYLWRIGALDWGPRTLRRQRRGNVTEPGR